MIYDVDLFVLWLANGIFMFLTGVVLVTIGVWLLMDEDKSDVGTKSKSR